MGDVTKLPKWAQAEIKKLQEEKAAYTVQNCHFEQGTVKHNKHTRDSISAVAMAIEANAKAAEALAKSISSNSVDQSFDAALRIR